MNLDALTFHIGLKARQEGYYHNYYHSYHSYHSYHYHNYHNYYCYIEHHTDLLSVRCCGCWRSCRRPSTYRPRVTTAGPPSLRWHRAIIIVIITVIICRPFCLFFLFFLFFLFLFFLFFTIWCHFLFPFSSPSLPLFPTLPLYPFLLPSPPPLQALCAAGRSEEAVEILMVRTCDTYLQIPPCLDTLPSKILSQGEYPRIV